MSTHHNLNVNGRISAESWYPTNMVHGQRSTILGACPLYRKLICNSRKRCEWLISEWMDSRHIRIDGVSLVNHELTRKAAADYPFYSERQLFHFSKAFP